MPTDIDSGLVALFFSFITGVAFPVGRWYIQKRKTEEHESVEMASQREASSQAAANQWRDIAERMEKKYIEVDERLRIAEQAMSDMRVRFTWLYDAFEYLAKEVEGTNAAAVTIARAKAAGRYSPGEKDRTP